MESNMGRAMVALTALVVLVGGFILLTGEDDAGEGSGDVPSTTTTEATTDATTANDEPKPEPEPEVPTIVVEDGVPVDGVAELEFSAGEEVAFAVESDMKEEVHVHGYDIEQALPAGESTEISFPADLDGIFEVELHGSATQIAELTVKP